MYCVARIMERSKGEGSAFDWLEAVDLELLEEPRVFLLSLVVLLLYRFLLHPTYEAIRRLGGW